jgi:hypothetical protein
MEVVAEVASWTILSDKVQIIKLLKTITNVAQSWMNQLSKQLLLIHHSVHTSAIVDQSFAHHFHD